MKSYVAFLTPERDGRFTVEFPDLPGCLTEGASVEEAAENAREAMSAWMGSVLKADEAIPEPSPVADVVAGKQPADIVLLIEAPPVAQRMITISISMREGQLRDIDDKARAAGMTRSGWMTYSSSMGAPPIPVRGNAGRTTGLSDARAKFTAAKTGSPRTTAASAKKPKLPRGWHIAKAGQVKKLREIG